MEQLPTLYPADLAKLSIAELAALPAAQKLEIRQNLTEAMVWLKEVNDIFEAAMDLCYGERARFARQSTQRDFGTVNLVDEDCIVKCELPKKVTWDQQRLNTIAERIVEAGEEVSSYIEAKLTVAESKFNNWPPSLQQQFIDARTVDAGKPKYTLTRREDQK